MKIITLSALTALLLAVGVAAAAEDEVKTIEIKDTEWGQLTIKLVDDGEPVYQPTKMTVTLKCNDQRKQKNAVLPKDEVLLQDEALCEFISHKFDKEAKILTVRFSTAEAAPGEARCNAEWTQSFDLKDLCAEWSGR